MEAAAAGCKEKEEGQLSARFQNENADRASRQLTSAELQSNDLIFCSSPLSRASSMLQNQLLKASFCSSIMLVYCSLFACSSGMSYMRTCCPLMVREMCWWEGPHAAEAPVGRGEKDVSEGYKEEEKGKEQVLVLFAIPDEVAPLHQASVLATFPSDEIIGLIGGSERE